MRELPSKNRRKAAVKLEIVTVYGTNGALAYLDDAGVVQDPHPGFEIGKTSFCCERWCCTTRRAVIRQSVDRERVYLLAYAWG